MVSRHRKVADGWARRAGGTIAGAATAALSLLPSTAAMQACAPEPAPFAPESIDTRRPSVAARHDAAAGEPAPVALDAAAPVAGACVGAADGLYCGVSLGADADSLVRCEDDGVAEVRTCARGCDTQPPGTADRCVTSDPCAGAGDGDGDYCGGPLGAAQSTLYRCVGGVTTSTKECPGGCAVKPAGSADRCVEAEHGYRLPLACGSSSTVTQGNDSGYSHVGKARYAFDFKLPRGTTLVAMRAGTVRAIRNATQPGDSCWSGGGPACADYANRVVLDHDDGTSTLYLHLDFVAVRVGQVVSAGETVGRSGGTGWSTGPHAHVQRQARCASSYWCQSIPLHFDEFLENDGVPHAGNIFHASLCP